MMDRRSVEHYKNALWSDDDKVVLEAIQELREKDISLLLDDVFDVFNNCSEKVYHALYQFICDIKEPRAVDVFVNRLQHPDFQSHKNALLSACWQTPLSFDEHLTFFVETAMQGTATDALEIHTLIENNMPNANCGQSLRNKLIDQAKQEQGLKADILHDVAALLKVVDQ